MQHVVAHALGLAAHQVQVQCRRMGGGFGGKETQAGHVAVWAALAARKFARPVKLRLDRDDDFLITGKRHPFAYDYDVGFDDSGRLCGMKLTMLANCGFSADLSGPVADRAVFHCDNAYYLGDVEIASFRCRTHMQSHTAFRGFGGPQGVIAIEAILGEIARALGLDALDVRRRNFYGTRERNVTHYQMPVEDNILHDLLPKLEQSAQYRRRQEAIAAWNAQQPVLKRGLAITPVKFGISFTATLFNQAGGLVHVYTDGSVQVNHGGTEMGQGLHTKVAQIVADELGVPLHRVLVTASDTSKVPNASATAASSGTDLNGRAAQYAARNVRDNLAAFVCGLDGCGAGAIRFEGGMVTSPKAVRRFEEVVAEALGEGVEPGLGGAVDEVGAAHPLTGHRTHSDDLSEPLRTQLLPQQHTHRHRGRVVDVGLGDGQLLVLPRLLVVALDTERDDRHVDVPTGECLVDDIGMGLGGAGIEVDALHRRRAGGLELFDGRGSRRIAGDRGQHDPHRPLLQILLGDGQPDLGATAQDQDRLGNADGVEHLFLSFSSGAAS